MVSLFLIGYTGLARAKNGDEVKKYRKNLRSGVMSTATLGGRRGLSDWYVDARDRSGVKGSIRFARRKDAEEYAQYLIGEKLVKQPPKIRRASPSRRKSAAAG
jgi:hypothetical protein